MSYASGNALRVRYDKKNATCSERVAFFVRSSRHFTGSSLMKKRHGEKLLMQLELFGSDTALIVVLPLFVVSLLVIVFVHKISGGGNDQQQCAHHCKE
jgi:hypothetical protein